MGKRPKCFMCSRKAKALTAGRDGSTYCNAQNVVLFCSVRCAANYGLLWGFPEVVDHWHFCAQTNEWECVEADACLKCRTVETEGD
jgi:hypothetical protein